MPIIVGNPTSPEASPHMFKRAELIASDALQSERLEICGTCDNNENGKCRACCDGTPVEILVRLTISKCSKNKWGSTPHEKG